jgi:hypothetical protein
MGKKNSRVAKTEKQLEKDGIKFVSANNKTLRLFFESQFHKDMDIDDFHYLNHIFEVKTYLYYNKHYNRFNLLNIHRFLKDQVTKLIESKFYSIHEAQFENTGVLDKILSETIRFTIYHGKRLMLVNSNLAADEKFIDDFTFFNVNDEFIENLEKAEYLKIYIKQNMNSSLIMFVLLKVLTKFKHGIKKIKIYQVGVSSIDEEAFLLLAEFLEINKGIESIAIKGKLMDDFRYEDQDEQNMTNDDSFMAVEIQNKTFVLTLYDFLSTTHNLLELRLFAFLQDHSLVLIANAIKHNPQLRVLEVKNLCSGSTANTRELDFTNKYYNDLGDNIKDEIYIFFNYVSTLENLEKLIITNFMFNSDINFFACEIAKCLKKLKVLKLDQNQAIVTNDTILNDCYQLSSTSLETIGMGLTYFHMIRRFDLLINKDILKHIDIGVLDFASLASFLRFVEHSNLEKIRVALNKPCENESLKFLFKTISFHIFNMKNLKSITFCNTYTDETFTNYRREIDGLLTKYFLIKLKTNRNIRKINLKYRTNNITAFLLSGFGYIKEKYHEMCFAVLYAMDKFLADHAKGQMSRENKFKIKQLVLKQLYCKYRKISI